jgi:hypothetical protein
MEGAVRSGCLAAESLLRAHGKNAVTVLVPDLPAGGIIRLF